MKTLGGHLFCLVCSDWGRRAEWPGRRAKARGRKKIWASGLPSGCRGRSCGLEKRGLASARGTRSHDVAGQHRRLDELGEVCLEYVAPVSRPALSKRLNPESVRFPSSTPDCSRARSTADKGRDAELPVSKNPEYDASQEQLAPHLDAPLDVQQHQSAMVQSESATRDSGRSAGLISSGSFCRLRNVGP